MQRDKPARLRANPSASPAAVSTGPVPQLTLMNADWLHLTGAGAWSLLYDAAEAFPLIGHEDVI